MGVFANLHAQKKQVFTGLYAESEEETEEEDKVYRWAIKTDLGNMTSGDFNLVGEYRLLKRLSIEAGGGYTFDYLLDFFQLDDLKVKLATNAYATGGFSARAGFKFYFDRYDAPIDGWWLGITGYMRQNNYGNRYEDVTYKNSKSKIGLGITMGRQFIAPSSVISEVYWGLSLVGIERAYYVTGYNDENVWVENDYRKEHKTTINLLVGFRLGIGR